MEYKAYSFDLDDNLLRLPTKIYLRNEKQEIQEFSTLKFEKIRSKLKKLNLEITKDSFIDFEDDKRFLEEIPKSKKAGSWKKFERCIVEDSSIFAIITARGNSPSIIKKGIKIAILKHIPKNKLIKFSNNFLEKYNLHTKDKSIEHTLDLYLNLCKFYPVNNNQIKKRLKSNEVSELKSIAFREFREYITKYAKEKFGKDIFVKIGFSDDSKTNIDKMINDVLRKEGIYFYETKRKKTIKHK